MTARVEKVITSGRFELDGGSWDVDNNIWLVGNDDEVIVIDAAHDATPIVEAVNGRRVIALILTHGHNDHINAAVDVAQATSAPIWLAAADRMLWDAVHQTVPDHLLSDGAEFDVAGVRLRALATPGHSPGSTCLYSPELNALFSGDTLFEGGPGATGRSYSDYDTIVSSIRRRLLVLPPTTRVHTGHGPETTIGNEAENIGAG